VVAPDVARAQVLVSHWVAMYPGKFLRIDVYASMGLGPWLDAIGLPNVSTGVTMVKGRVPRRDPELHTFALVNQALG
jgi:Acetyltransferase (GNAT) domain